MSKRELPQGVQIEVLQAKLCVLRAPNDWCRLSDAESLTGESMYMSRP